VQFQIYTLSSWYKRQKHASHQQLTEKKTWVQAKVAAANEGQSERLFQTAGAFIPKIKDKAGRSWEKKEKKTNQPKAVRAEPIWPIHLGLGKGAPLNSRWAQEILAPLSVSIDDELSVKHGWYDQTEKRRKGGERSNEQRNGDR